MSYCFNPACQKPQNPDHNKFCQTCGTKLWLREHYRLLKLIGRGTFSRTFLAIDEDLPSKPFCVIKQFFPGQFSPSAAVTQAMAKASELFRREALQLDKLGKHPQIPQLLAYFEQSPCQYLVQEFIEGQNLAQILATQGPFQENQIRNLLENLLPILQFIHDNQVIHRDIKPENIIADPAGVNLYLVGFEAAKVITPYTPLLPMGTVIGSPEYTAPEQLKGHPVFASDLYSLGVTCLELLTQVSPFDLRQGETWQWQLHLGRPVSGFLAQILEKMLEPSLRQRYQSAAEVLTDLSQVRGGQWKCTQTLAGHTLSVKSVVISPDNQWLVSGSEDSTIKLWNLQHIQEPTILGGWLGNHTGWISDLVLSPDGYTLISASGDRTIKVWNLGTGKVLQTLGGWLSQSLTPVTGIALSQDGQILVSSHSDSTVKIWQLSRGRLHKSLSGHGTWMEAVAITADARVIAGGSGDGTIQLWCRETGQSLETLKGHGGPVRALVFSADGQLLISGSSDTTVNLWQVTTGELLGSLPQGGAVNGLALSADGQRLVCGIQDGTVKLWHPYTQQSQGELLQGAGVQDVALSANGQILVVGCTNGTIKIWQLCELEKS